MRQEKKSMRQVIFQRGTYVIIEVHYPKSFKRAEQIFKSWLKRNQLDSERYDYYVLSE